MYRIRILYYTLHMSVELPPKQASGEFAFNPIRPIRAAWVYYVINSRQQKKTNYYKSLLVVEDFWPITFSGLGSGAKTAF